MADEPQGQWYAVENAVYRRDDSAEIIVNVGPDVAALARCVADALNARPAPAPTAVPSVEDIFDKLPVESGLHSYLTDGTVEAVRDAVIDALSARTGTEDENPYLADPNLRWSARTDAEDDPIVTFAYAYDDVDRLARGGDERARGVIDRVRRMMTARTDAEDGRSPEFVLGYYEGWAGAKAGRQYSEGQHGQRSGIASDTARAERALAAFAIWERAASKVKVVRIPTGDDGALSARPGTPPFGERCPRCNSSNQRWHPAMQEGGEVQPCSDPWHGPHRGCASCGLIRSDCKCARTNTEGDTDV